MGRLARLWKTGITDLVKATQGTPRLSGVVITKSRLADAPPVGTLIPWLELEPPASNSEWWKIKNQPASRRRGWLVESPGMIQLPGRLSRIGRRAYARAFRGIWNQPDFSMTLDFEKLSSKGFVAELAYMILCMFGGAAILFPGFRLPWAFDLWRSSERLSFSIVMLVTLLYALFFVTLPVMLLKVKWERLHRPYAASSTVTNKGLTATLRDGRVLTFPWSHLKEVRKNILDFGNQQQVWVQHQSLQGRLLLDAIERFQYPKTSIRRTNSVRALRVRALIGSLSLCLALYLFFLWIEPELAVSKTHWVYMWAFISVLSTLGLMSIPFASRIAAFTDNLHKRFDRWQRRRAHRNSTLTDNPGKQTDHG